MTEVVLSPDGKIIATCSNQRYMGEEGRDANVQFWDANLGICIRILKFDFGSKPNIQTYAKIPRTDQ
jgi:hypothetical protein